MRRVYASPVVAKVHHCATRREDAECEQVRDAVRSLRLPADTEEPVAARVGRARPHPATSRSSGSVGLYPEPSGITSREHASPLVVCGSNLADTDRPNSTSVLIHRGEPITHVGIYLGDGQMVNAPVEGKPISVMPVFSGFWGAHYAGGGRPLG
jgi:hypothetical protein